MALPLVFVALRAAELVSTDAVAVLWRGKTWTAALRTLTLGVGVGLLSVGIALPLAWLTHASDLPGRRFWRVALNLPLAVPSYVSGFIVMATFSHGGWLHALLEPLGVAQMPDIRGGVGATLALLFHFPLALITLQAALDRVDPRTWEAARALGCSPRQAFTRVVLPALRPALASGGLLVGLYAVGDFGAVSLLRYKSLSYIIYLRQGSLSDTFRDEAVFLALILVILSIGLVVVLERFAGASARALSSQSQARRWPVIPLGRWRWPALAACALVTAAGLGLPVAVVLFWWIRGVMLDHTITVAWDAAAITLGLGAVSALVLVALATVPALLGRFVGGRAARAVGLMAHVGYALPGIVVALALLSMVTAHAYPLYQTLTLLLLAYLVRYLPLAIHTLSDALNSQNPRTYDAARALGCTPPRAWQRVVLPGAQAGLWAGLLAVFIAIIKELPITLLLSPIDLPLPGVETAPRFRTLATSIWTLTADAYFSEVAPIVLLLLVLATLGLLLRPDRNARR